jgi:thioredoxin 1
MTQQISSAEWQEKVLDASKPVLVDFYATWCGPCKAMAPVIDEIAVEKAGEIDVFKIDIDEDMDVAQRYKIMSVPTFAVFKGGELVASAVGSLPKDKVIALIG